MTDYLREEADTDALEDEFVYGPACDDYNECGCASSTQDNPHCMYCLHSKADHERMMPMTDDERKRIIDKIHRDIAEIGKEYDAERSQGG